MAKLDSYCLDTHALVWYFRGQDSLSIKAREVIDRVFSGNAIGFIPTLVILEVFYVSLKHKDFIFPSFLDFLRRKSIMIVSFDRVVLNQSFELPSELDIHDRIITATAISANSLLVTKDRVLRSLFPLETIW